MREELEQKLARFEELERQMVDPEVLASGPRLAAVAREHGSLAKTTKRYRRFKQLNQQIAEAQDMMKTGDAEMRELAESELPDLRAARESIWEELLDANIGGDDAERSRCVMEIRAGTGGDEASLFARDLFEMYRRYCEERRWKFEVLDASLNELGGFKEVIVGIEGENCFRQLQYESGGHRVQRVPETEAKGRVHTSAATVAVLPEPEDVEVELNREDYVEETMRASGPGGQHVNKTSSAIRLTHPESGIVVYCQDEKSQHKNRAKALRILKTRLYERKREQEHQKRADVRRTMIGSGDRSQRIRTYNFPQNRLTDHRINFDLYHLDTVMVGRLEPMIEALVDYDRRQLRDMFGTNE